MSTQDQACGKIGELLSGYLDNELTQQDSQRVRVHLETCAACRKLHAELAGVQAQLRQLSYPKDDEAVLAALENDLIANTAAGIGWLLVLGGLVVVVGAALWFFFNDPSVPGVVRLFHAVFLLGMLGLFISVLRQRLLSYKHDKYRKVKL